MEPIITRSLTLVFDRANYFTNIDFIGLVSILTHIFFLKKVTDANQLLLFSVQFIKCVEVSTQHESDNTQEAFEAISTITIKKFTATNCENIFRLFPLEPLDLNTVHKRKCSKAASLHVQTSPQAFKQLPTFEGHSHS